MENTANGLYAMKYSGPNKALMRTLHAHSKSGVMLYTWFKRRQCENNCECKSLSHTQTHTHTHTHTHTLTLNTHSHTHTKHTRTKKQTEVIPFNKVFHFVFLAATMEALAEGK